MKQKFKAALLGLVGLAFLTYTLYTSLASFQTLYAPSPALPAARAPRTQTLIIQNFGQEVILDNTRYIVENATKQEDFYVLRCSLDIENVYPETFGVEYLYRDGDRQRVYTNLNVSKSAYEYALTTEAPVYSTIVSQEAQPIAPSVPPSVNVLPVATAVAAIGLIAVAIWVGYRQAWGDATSTLLERGLHDMTIRDVEIVGYIMQRKEFTIPELMKLSKASKITVWRTVQRLIEQKLVEPTGQTRPAANGLGGRGKPSQVYRYVGEKK